jgi:Zn-dependent protease
MEYNYTYDIASSADPALGIGMLGIVGAMLIPALIMGLVLYIYSSWATMVIANKLNVPNGWLAFIPIANVYLMTQMADVPAWMTLLILLPIIPFLGGLAFMAIMIWWWWKICEKRGREGWWSLLMLIPIVNLVILGMLAWSEANGPTAGKQTQ